MARAEPEGRVRLNLAITEPVKQRIERLQELAEGASITEVIRRALAHYETLLESRKRGESVLLRSKDGKRTEVLRVL